jgi:hypothetical protein
MEPLSLQLPRATARPFVQDLPRPVRHANQHERQEEAERQTDDGGLEHAKAEIDVVE